MPLSKLSVCFLFLLAWALIGCPGMLETSIGDQPYQQGGLRYQDYVYRSNIRSVQLYRAPVEESYPVLYLNDQTEALTLEFDELLSPEQRETDFFVDLISCDVNWKPSGMVPIEFYDGFTTDRIGDFQRSAPVTKIPYVHYWYSFPQEEESFKRSGNYLLKVYRNNDPDDVVITRRFVVVEQRVPVQLKYEVSEQMIRQEFQQFSFEVIPNRIQTFNPVQDLRIQVMQNFRWDNALRLQQPRFQSEEALEYQVQVNQDYLSGQEFRRHELESTRLLSQSVQDIEEREDIWNVFLYPDQPRDLNRFGSRLDHNGSYGLRTAEYNDPDLEGDYLHNHFFLDTGQPRPEGEEIYLFGELTDWNLLPEFRMDWSDTYQRYQTEVVLKQGIYDYQYVVKYPDRATPDPRPMEGLRRATENFYSILVYFRKPGDRAEQIVGFQPVNYRE